ncbi:MAG: aspartate carbamoyltransferase, partial [Methanomassiliicoccales archaeon]
MAKPPFTDFVSVRDLTRDQLLSLLKKAGEMMPYARGEKRASAMNGKILGTLFYEPSTRTRLSFESAMVRLGGAVIGFTSATGTSVEKGENLSDTIRVTESYADILVIRHPLEGAARLAADLSNKPVINAGDGAGQHPTQTLLDLYTILEAKKRLEGVHVVLLGDLKFGRTVHSLAEALALFGARLTLVSPPSLEMPRDVLNQIESNGIRPEQISSLDEAVSDADVLYVTRIQKERFADPAEYAKVAGSYRIDRRILSIAKSDMSVMHPLPRVGEIDPDIDSLPNSLYFRQ